MRIMIDSNIIVSAVLFPESIIASILGDIKSRHELVISSYCLMEVRRVFIRKFSDKLRSLDLFLNSTDFKIHETFGSHTIKKVQIRDASDLPVLISFIESEADLLVSGDNDFYSAELSCYNIVSPKEYLIKFMKDD